jgi:hypothetical protein
MSTCKVGVEPTNEFVFAEVIKIISDKAGQPASASGLRAGGNTESKFECKFRSNFNTLHR